MKTLGQVLSEIDRYVKLQPSEQSAFHQAISNFVDDEKMAYAKQSIKAIFDSMKCLSCGGSGEHSTPSSFDPCNDCEGSGFATFEGCCKDIFRQYLSL